jgi:hypothetical protein
MARMRFNKAEREIIAAAAAGNGLIEWQNVTQWHPARITDPAIAVDYGRQFITAENREDTRTVGLGRPVRVTPGHIRAAA